MPGPGGGSHGGGFGGGSHGGGFGGGGGSHGGGFGGPRGPRSSRGGRVPPPPGGRMPPFGGMHFYFGPRRPYVYGGGGCLGGFMGMITVSVILLVVAAVLLIGFVGSAFSNIFNGGEVKYDEAAFEEYADKRYSEAFGSSPAYEDNILIVFAVNKESDGYYAIAWVGDNIRSEISNMFGDEYTVFGSAMQNSVNSSYYAYSLDSNLASVMDTMTKAVTGLGLESSFYSETSRPGSEASYVDNRTDLQITKETVNRSLQNFTDKTGIPTVIVVDTEDNVFGRSISFSDHIVLSITIGLVVLAVYLIYKAVKKRKSEAGQAGNNGSGG